MIRVTYLVQVVPLRVATAFFCMIEMLVSYILCVLIGFILYLWHEERKMHFLERERLQEQHLKQITDLLNRIQAPTFTEYQTTTEPEPNKIDTTDPDLVSIEDAREELMNG